MCQPCKQYHKKDNLVCAALGCPMLSRWIPIILVEVKGQLMSAEVKLGKSFEHISKCLSWKDLVKWNCPILSGCFQWRLSSVKVSSSQDVKNLVVHWRSQVILKSAIDKTWKTWHTNSKVDWFDTLVWRCLIISNSCTLC